MLLDEVGMSKVETSVVLVQLEETKRVQYLYENQVRSYRLKRRSSINLIRNSPARRSKKYLNKFWHSAHRLERKG